MSGSNGDTRFTGLVKWFNNTKGFGFIVPDKDTKVKKDVFVHYSAISGTGYRKLEEGDRVEFAIEETKKGLHAKEVVVL